MKTEIELLHNVWAANRAQQLTTDQHLSFNELTNSIVSTGPFSFYIIDFFDMAISHISASLYEMHGFEPEDLSFNDLLAAIHPEDIGFVIKAEAFIAKFFVEKMSPDKLLRYKITYNYRARIIGGDYVLFNHQALMLTLDENNGYGKSLNINTRIDHLSHTNNFKISLIGLHGEPSYMNLSLEENDTLPAVFSKREMDIIKLISEGLSSCEIAEKLFISELTVRKHRNNILTKANCKNTAQLIKICVLQGLV